MNQENKQSDQETNEVYTWHFYEYDRILLNQNLIDVSRQFLRIGMLTDYFDYNIKFNLKSDKPLINNAEWSFFKDYEDFYTKYCDVKITSIKTSSFELETFLTNSLNSEDLFPALLLQMYPIYKLLNLRKTRDDQKYFRQFKVLTNVYLDGKQKEMNIKFPVANVLLEEIYIVNALENFNAFKHLPGNISPDLFWTFFVYSIHFPQEKYYVYKSFILNWHKKKGIPMLDLFIYTTIAEHTIAVFFYLKIFLDYFYNNDYLKTNNIKNIKACWNKKLAFENNMDINVQNDTIFVNKSNEDPVLKLFPLILCHSNEALNKYKLCIYYKTNISNLKLNFSYVDNNNKKMSKKSKLFKRLFKHVIEIDGELLKKSSFFSNIKIELRADSELKMFFGTNQLYSNEINGSIKFTFNVQELSHQKLKSDYQVLLERSSKSKKFFLLDIDSRSSIFFEPLKCLKPFPVEYSKAMTKTSNLISISHKEIKEKVKFNYEFSNVDNEKIMFTLFGVKRSEKINDIVEYDAFEDFLKKNLFDSFESRLMPFISLDKIIFDTKEFNKFDIKYYDRSGGLSFNQHLENFYFFKTLQETGICVKDYIPSVDYNNLYPQMYLDINSNDDLIDYSYVLSKFKKKHLVNLKNSIFLPETEKNTKLDRYLILSKCEPLNVTYNCFVDMQKEVTACNIKFQIERAQNLIKKQDNIKLKMSLFTHYNHNDEMFNNTEVLKSNSENNFISWQGNIYKDFKGRNFTLTIDESNLIRSYTIPNTEFPFKLEFWVNLVLYNKSEDIQAYIFLHIFDFLIKNET